MFWAEIVLLISCIASLIGYIAHEWGYTHPCNSCGGTGRNHVPMLGPGDKCWHCAGRGFNKKGKK